MSFLLLFLLKLELQAHSLECFLVFVRHGVAHYFVADQTDEPRRNYEMLTAARSCHVNHDFVVCESEVLLLSHHRSLTSALVPFVVSRQLFAIGHTFLELDAH